MELTCYGTRCSKARYSSQEDVRYIHREARPERGAWGANSARGYCETPVTARISVGETPVTARISVASEAAQEIQELQAPL